MKAFVSFAIFFIFTSGNFCFSQTNALIDSLKQLLNNDVEDSIRVNLLDDICWEYKYSNPDTAMKYCNRAAELAQKNNLQSALCRILSHTGILHEVKGNYDTALEFQMKALSISEKINNKQLISSCLSNIGIIYDFQKKFDDALKYLQEALTIAQAIPDSTGIVSRLLNIGDVYNHTGSYEKALEIYAEALLISEKLSEKFIGINDDKNSRYLKKLIANNCNNVGTIHYKRGNSAEALYYYQKSLKVKESLNDLNGAGNTVINIAGVYMQLGNFPKAIEYCEKGINIGNEVKSKLRLAQAYSALSAIYNMQKNYHKAYENHVLYSQIKDSLFNEQSSKQITEMQIKYETEKKELQIENLNKDNGIKSAEIKKQNIQKIAFASGFALMLILAFVIFRGYKQKQKANEIISAQKNEVEKQKEIVEEKNNSLGTAYQKIKEKNTEILDSIHYAKRIQEAILPPQKLVKTYLENSFILYKPKDIVAGDFYWMQPVTPAALVHSGRPLNEAGENSAILFACCDCTGHGVPGAFVSILGYNALNRCVKEFGLTKPSDILDKLCEIFDEAFSKSELDIKDGMDMALCAYVGTQNFVSLQYAGAGNSLYLVRKNHSVQTTHALPQPNAFSLVEYPANKQPIGKFPYRKPFTNHEIPLQKGDAIYIFTDGYADQFGGHKGKKFKYSCFEQLLVSIQDKTMAEQREILNDTIEKWKGDLQQLDDICIIGVRV